MGSFGFYDVSMAIISGTAQVITIFRATSMRPDTFKMTFNKFKFFSAWVNEGLRGLVRMTLTWEVHACWEVEKDCEL